MASVERAKHPPDAKVAAWLAARTGMPLDQVERSLDEGARRRAFVVCELLEAGVRGGELLELVVRLTGLDDAGARALIAAHQDAYPK